jgi:hypothetical protein
MDFNLRKKLVKCYIWNTAFYGAESWTLRKVDQKYWQVLNMVLEKDGKDRVHLSCERRGSINIKEGEKCPAYNKKDES